MWSFLAKLPAAWANGLLPLLLCAHNAGMGIGDLRIIREYMQAHNIVTKANIDKQRKNR